MRPEEFPANNNNVSKNVRHKSWVLNKTIIGENNLLNNEPSWAKKIFIEDR